MKKLLTRFVLTTFVLVMASSLYAQGTWSTASSDGFTARFGPTANEVGGKIYVAGGLNNDLGGCINILEVFDPYTNSWSTPSTTGTFTPRFSASSAVVEGNIYVMGGVGGVFPDNDTLNLLEVFNPSTNTWSTPATTGTFTARANFTAAVVNGKIFVIGGIDGGILIPTLEIFDPTTNTWSTPTVTGTFTPRRSLASCVVDGKIYTFGGYSGQTHHYTLEVFDPLANNWGTPSTTGTFTPRRGLTTTILDGKIYAIGGSDGSYLNTVEVLDPLTNAWTTPSTSGTFTARYGHTASVVGGKIYTFGGQTGVTSTTLSTNISEVFTPETSSVAPDAASEAFALSPNPTSGIVTIHGEQLHSAKVSIVNILGETLLIQENVRADDTSVDLSNLPSGAYYIRIASPTSITTKMVVKK